MFPSHDRVGENLVKIYFESGAFELAARLGDKILARQDFLSPQFKHRLVLSNYNAGKHMRAYEVLNLPQTETFGGRKLANAGEFERVSGLLKKKFTRSRM